MGYIITFMAGFIVGSAIMTILAISGSADREQEAYNAGYSAGYNKGAKKDRDVNNA